MKKIFMMLVVVMLMAATSCAQSSKPAAKVQMSKSEGEAKLKPFFEKIEALPEEEQTEEKLKTMALEFAKENPNDAGVYVIRAILAYTMSPEELLEFVDGNEYFKEDTTLMEAKKEWQVQMETSEGKMFKDFSAEYEGKVTKFSDYVGKGKYVLVDFWASWCGPCRAEIPNLINVYNKYKGDKFEVLGVATWDKPEDTKKAIAEMGIPYPQIMNAQKAGSDAYGISGIPQIILFGPDGKIVKRNLRGEAVEKAVAEILK